MRRSLFSDVILMLGAGAITALPLVCDRLYLLGFVSFALPAYIEYTVSDADRKKRRAYLRGIAFFIGFGAVLFSWFTELSSLDFTGLSSLGAAAVVIAGWLGLSLLQASVKALLFVVLGIASKIFKLYKRGCLFSFVFAVLYVIFEWIEHQTWAGVPWGSLAIGQASFLPMIQSASVFGSYFVSFVLVFFGASVGVTLAMLFEKSGKCLRLKLMPTVLGAALLLANIAFGYARVNTYRIPSENGTVRVAAVQGNISSYEKWSDDSSEKSYSVYSELTEEAANDGAAIVVWPETPIIFNLSGSYGYEARMFYRSVSRDNGITLISGAFTMSDDLVEENSVIAVDPEYGIGDSYYVKRKLVPFGEFVPFRSIISKVYPPLAELSVIEDDLAHGTEPVVLDTEYGKVAPIICFDSIYSDVVRDSVRAGGELLTLSTNDSWFGDSAAGGEHNRHAVMRAVECGRYLVRSASTGISSVISPTGKIENSIGQLEMGYITADVTMIDEDTLYVQIGDAIIPTLIFLAVSALEISYVCERRSREKGGNGA